MLQLDRALPTEPDCRNVVEEDAPALGALMLAAYRDTVDYEGETLTDAVAEVRKTLAGGYGPFLSNCSFLAERAGGPVAACLVTLGDDGRTPLLAFSITHPGFQRQGLAGRLIGNAAKALIERGFTELALVVTGTNEPARRLYEKLGFRSAGGPLGPPAGQA